MTKKFVDELTSSMKLCYNPGSSCEYCMYYVGFGYPDCMKQLLKTSCETIEYLVMSNKRKDNKVKRMRAEQNTEEADSE